MAFRVRANYLLAGGVALAALGSRHGAGGREIQSQPRHVEPRAGRKGRGRDQGRSQPTSSSLSRASSPSPSTRWDPPIATYASDAATVVGADPDLAQLLADSFGLELNLVSVAWAGLAARRHLRQV